MKRYLTVIYLLLSIPIYVKPQKVFIRGDIYYFVNKPNYLTVEKFQFSLQKRNILSEINPIPVSNGVEKFSTEINCDFPQVIKLFYKDIFVNPGDSINVKYFYDFDEDNHLNDSLAVESKYPLDLLFYEKLDKNKLEVSPRYDDKKYLNNVVLYKTDVDLYYKSISDYLQQHRNEISNEFWEYLKKDLLFRKMSMLCLPVELNMITKDKLPDNYFSEFKLLPENNNKLIDMFSYCRALTLSVTLVNYDGDRNKLDFPQFSDLLDEVAKRKAGIVRDYLMFSICNWCFKKAQPDVIRKVRKELEKYLNKFSGFGYRKAIEENYPFQFAKNSSKEIEPKIGKILLKDYSGKVYSFDEMIAKNNKLAYIDIWSTTCLPCIKEIPLSQELFNTKYKENYVNIYLAIDEDFFKWKQMSKDLKIPEEQSYLLFQKSDDENFEDYFNVVSFPHCILIDGMKVVNYNMPRASTPDLLENELNYQYNKMNEKRKSTVPPPPKL